MNKHQNVHIIFSLSLFLLFVIGSFFVIAYEIRGYQMINQTCQNEDDLITPLAYLNTKIKAADNSDAIDTVIVDNITCLQIQTDQTKTYIYFDDGYLKELYITNDYSVDLKKGDKLFLLDNFYIEKNNRLFKFVVEKNDLQKQISINVHG